MDKIFIADLAEGQSIYNVFQVRRKDLIPFKGKQGKFLSLILGDKSGEIDAKLWDKGEEQAAGFNTHDFVLVKGTVTTYNKKLQLTVANLKKTAIKDEELSYFLPTSPQDPAEMWAELQKEAKVVTNPYFKLLIQSFFDDQDLIRGFRRAPAAKAHHHAYLGGLLEHTLNVIQLSQSIASTYDGVDHELLFVGALFHDLGKVHEFRYDYLIDYSDAGRLLGHIVIGTELINDKIKAIPDFPEALRLKILHMIISHHGKYEWQSPKRPKFLEAALLHQADNLDAQADKFLQVKKELTGEDWPYVRTLERYVFTG